MQAPNEKPEGAIPVFILGLLGILLCAPLGIVAWLMGNSYVERCRAAGVAPEGLGVAGRIMGIIATVLLIIGIVATVLMMLLGGGMFVMRQ